MNWSKIFIDRPIATSLLMAGIALVGLLAFRTLAIADLPNIDFPTINVSASLPGADPATMASTVATVLERQFTAIAGLDSMTSNSSTGATQIALQFSLKRDIDGAATDIQAAIAAAIPLLPPEMPFPPSLRKTNPADQPVMYLWLMSDTLPLYQLNDYSDLLVVPRLSTVPGVAQIVVNGPQKYAVRVQVDPDRLVSKRIGLNEVNSAIAAANPNLPTGTLFGPGQNYTVKTNAELKNAAQFGNVILAWRNGAPVRLGEVADVIDSVEDTRTAAWAYTATGPQRVIQLNVMRQIGGNDMVIGDSIKALLPQIQAQLPPAARLFIRSDRSRLIRQSFADTRMTLALSLGLVIAVIFVFLGNLSATMIPTLAIPFSLLGTVAIMAVLNYTLDNLSTMAVILSLSFIMDDAIVMLENVMRHVEGGLEPYMATVKASQEICFTILSMTVSLGAVFIPVLFMGGVLGVLFREFAVTITAAVVISGLVSISLTPMLCSRFLRVKGQAEKGWFGRALGWPLATMLRLYGWSLRGALRYRPIMALLFVAVLGATVYAFQKVPKGFLPDEDQDFMIVNFRAAQGTSFNQMIDYQRRVAQTLRAEPSVDVFVGSINNTNSGLFQVMLKPRRERSLGVVQLMDKLRPRLAIFPGFQSFLTVNQAIRIGARQSNSAFQFTLQAVDREELYKQAEVIEREIAKLPEVSDVSTDVQLKTPMQTVHIDRERAARFGLNALQIEAALYNAFGPQIASTIYTPASQYHVLEEIKPSYQQWTESLSKINFKGSGGQLVPLDTLATITPDVGPQSIPHSGQFPSVTISFNVKTGISLGAAVDRVSALAQRLLPQTVTGNFTGNAQAFQSSIGNLGLLLVISVGIVYIVLGALYESYIHPLTILSGLPAAGLGALVTLMYFKAELNIYSFVGLFTLLGIVQKNAIMQIDFALAAERRGKSCVEAAYEGCMSRFRPIMMTTMTAFFGALPVALGRGTAGEARRPLGLAVMGGLLFSQFMTLYLTPVVYTYMSRLIRTSPAVQGAPLAVIPVPVEEQAANARPPAATASSS
jgi:hydrophobe/amphiphile efflux-1 (HAE1) family protein